MITIRNSQRKVAVNQMKLRRDAEKILHILDYSEFDLGIWITNNSTIKRYNKNFRNINKATDILSFPFYPELKPGKRIKAASDEEKNLGDIIISAEYLFAQYQADGFENRLQRILVHGICHLLAYDHKTDTEFKIMNKLEKHLLLKLKD